MTKVILVSGYRRTGKDKLYSILSANDEFDGKFKWIIYKHPNNLKDFTSNDEKFKYIRTAFADALKQESSDEYKIPTTISDSEKDLEQFIHYKTGKNVSARDIYIEWGKIRRSQDLDYWCKAAFTSSNISSKEEMETSQHVSNTELYAYFVTDWRFTNEANYVLNNFNNVITVRVYRSNVPVPPIDVDSEHNLDNYRADFLLIPDGVEGEFEKAIKIFPQYTDYIPSGSV